NTKGPPPEVPASIASSSISFRDSSNVHDEVQGKRSRYPKKHSKGKMDVIGWDLVLYNRSTSEHVQLQL
nr:hypothetical protein [Tanacetum cinerariifolium]